MLTAQKAYERVRALRAKRLEEACAPVMDFIETKLVQAGRLEWNYPHPLAPDVVTHLRGLGYRVGECPGGHLITIPHPAPRRS